MIKAVQYIAKRYHIHAFTISAYNSKANGIVERLHFNVRQAMFKAADGDKSRWSQVAYLVFWAERITIRRRMGCSPYYAAVVGESVPLRSGVLGHPVTANEVSEEMKNTCRTRRTRRREEMKMRPKIFVRSEKDSERSPRVHALVK